MFRPLCGIGTFVRRLWHFSHSLLGMLGGVHDNLVAISFPVGSYLAASLDYHISCLEGAFFVASFSAYQSTRV